MDNVKKKRGEMTSDMSNLRMRTAEEIRKAGAPPPSPKTLKLK
jgi:hypothetical protein